tara:strand:- start:806 stop:973 length:168 start_codon:yes stop_codon:yes gene_type:complete
MTCKISIKITLKNNETRHKNLPFVDTVQGDYFDTPQQSPCHKKAPQLQGFQSKQY